MNTTSRAILQTLLASDTSLSFSERGHVQQLLNGEAFHPNGYSEGAAAHLLVTQKDAAKLLSVSRATIWRMTRDMRLHPVEVLPGMLRYRYSEIESFVAADGHDNFSAPSVVVSERRQKVG